MSHAKVLAGRVTGRGSEVGTSLAISELEGGDHGESLVTDGDGGTRGGQRGRSCGNCSAKQKHVQGEAETREDLESP